MVTSEVSSMKTSAVRRASPAVRRSPVAAQGLLITPDPDGQSGGRTAPRPAPVPFAPALHIVQHQGPGRDRRRRRDDDDRPGACKQRGQPRSAEGTSGSCRCRRGAVADSLHDDRRRQGDQRRGARRRQARARSTSRSCGAAAIPGLLEYAGEGMLRARIFPIPAKGEVGVTVRLRQVIQPTGGMYEWQLAAARRAARRRRSAAQVGLRGAHQVARRR